MSETLIIEGHEEPQKLETPPNCPVCGSKCVKIDTHWHCGRVVLLSELEDHYLGFNSLPKRLPKTGCPLCGTPMKNIGKWKHWPVTPTSKEEGLVRMHCDQSDHYCFVTKEWYKRNKR